MCFERIIFWDIDGTLMHCGNDGTKALNLAFAELFQIEDALTGVKVGSVMDYTLVNRVFAKHGISEDRLEEVKLRYIENLKRILSVNHTKRVLPGVIELLDLVQQTGTAVNALLTSNFKVGAMAKLASVGLADYFEIGAFGDAPGEKWHSAEDCLAGLSSAWGRLIDGSDAVLIGDGGYDIECAKRTGMRSIAVATGWTAPDILQELNPDHYFSDLRNTERVRRILNI